MSDKKFCTYCRTHQPSGTFHRYKSGKIVRDKCDRCWQASRLPLCQRDARGKEMGAANRKRSARLQQGAKSMKSKLKELP